MQAKIFHNYPQPDEDSSGHHAFYGTNLTVGQQVDIYLWEEAMQAHSATEAREFIARRQFEDQLGIRDPTIMPVSITSFRQQGRNPTFETISIRTDICDYPMFPEDVREWAIENRKTWPLRDELLDIVHEPYGFTFRDSFCQIELLLFALYLQSKKIGAGSQFFTGRLDSQLNATEEEIEAQWNKSQ